MGPDQGKGPGLMAGFFGMKSALDNCHLEQANSSHTPQARGRPIRVENLLRANRSCFPGSSVSIFWEVIYRSPWAETFVHDHCAVGWKSRKAKRMFCTIWLLDKESGMFTGRDGAKLPLDFITPFGVERPVVRMGAFDVGTAVLKKPQRAS